MSAAQTFSLQNICSVLAASIPHSLAGMLWAFITGLWSWQGLFIAIVLIGWIVIELVTRHGTFHYNSENGFSPAFNRFVGAGVYVGLQALVYFILKLIFGDIIYCMPWPYALHVVVFGSTGLLLHLSGFWPYLVEPGTKRKLRRSR